MTDEQTPAALAEGGEGPSVIVTQFRVWDSSKDSGTKLIEDCVWMSGAKQEPVVVMARSDFDALFAAALRAQSDRPSEDSARLDWLDRECPNVDFAVTPTSGPWVNVQINESIRAAIDAARASSPSPRTPAKAAVEVPETALPTMEDFSRLILDLGQAAAESSGDAYLECRERLLARIQQLHSRASEGGK